MPVCAIYCKCYNGGCTGSDAIITYAVTADSEDSIPEMAIIADAVADGVNDVLDSLYGTPPPTPSPTEKEGTDFDDLVNQMTDTAMDALDAISP